MAAAPDSRHAGLADRGRIAAKDFAVPAGGSVGGEGCRRSLRRERVAGCSAVIALPRAMGDDVSVREPLRNARYQRKLHHFAPRSRLWAVPFIRDPFAGSAKTSIPFWGRDAPYNTPKRLWAASKLKIQPYPYPLVCELRHRRDADGGAHAHGCTCKVGDQMRHGGWCRSGSTVPAPRTI